MPADRFIMPTLDTTPALPPDGIHFGMSFEDYLAAPAVGSGGMKEVLADPLRFWTRSWMNPHPPEKPEKDHQLYGHAFHCRILEGSDEFEARYYAEPDKADYKDLIETDGDLRAAIAEFEEKPVSGNKPDRINQLLHLWPDAPIWDHIVAQAAKDAGDRQALKAEWVRRFEAAAEAAENNAAILPLISEGHSEVSLFWHCPVTGIPKKARADRLHVGGMLDVKTFANQQERSMKRAIPKEIADRRYPFQPSHYLEGAQVVRDVVRRMECGAIFANGEQALPGNPLVDWVNDWAHHAEPDWWRWLFVQKGDAPTVLAVGYPVDGILREQFDMLCAEASERIRDFAVEFGGKPWAQHFDIWELEDNQIPAYAMEV
jgi:hypothetical protein